MTPTKIVELIIADDSQELAIDAISLVTSPAIEQDFVYFGKEKNNLTFAKVDEEKRMLVSPALIPNKQIFRHDPNTDSDYYVYFSPDTVRKASELYLKHNNHHKATYQHQDRVSGVLTVESWIKEGDSDKSKLYGYDLPNGTWFVKMKIENDELWNKIKDGELKGLSIEGYFTNKFEQMQKKEPTTEEVKTALKELLSKKKVEKVEFRNKKTLDKFLSEAKKITSELDTVKDEFSKLGDEASKWKDKFDDSFNKQDDLYADLLIAEKEAEKLKTTFEKAEENKKKISRKYSEVSVEYEEKMSEFIKVEKKGKDVYENFNNEIKEYIKKAENLGAKYDISEYKTAATKLKNTIT